MPGRNPELPEGTDHIINGAAELGTGNSASIGAGMTGGPSRATTGGTGGGSGTDMGAGGFVGSAGSGLDTGGLDTGMSGGGSSGGSTSGSGQSGSGQSGSGASGSGALTTGSGSGGGSTGSSGGGIKAQAASGVQNLRSQATDKARSYALDGKNRATSALDELAGMVDDAARQIDDKLGPQYGQYARQAAGAVTGFADTLRDKDVDDLFDDARNVIRKSPAVAIGVAAAVGFALVRLVKAGMPEQPQQVDFTPDGGRDVQFVSDDVAASAGAGASAGA